MAGKTGSRLVADSQFRLGAVQYAMGKYSEAIDSFDAFENRLAGSPKRAAARLGRGWALMKLGKPAEAGTFFEQIAEDGKLGIEARYWLGLSQKAQQHWAVAAKTLLGRRFGRARTSARPGDEVPCRQRASQRRRNCRSGEAVRPGARSRWRQRWTEQALVGKIAIALQEKDYASMDRETAEHSRRFPHSSFKADVNRMIARAGVERGQYAEALAILGRLKGTVTPAQQALEDRYCLALCYQGLKRYDEALEVLRPLLQSAAGQLRTDALLTEGSLHMAKKEFREAIAPLEAWDSATSCTRSRPPRWSSEAAGS